LLKSRNNVKFLGETDGGNMDGSHTEYGVGSSENQKKQREELAQRQEATSREVTRYSCGRRLRA
jgi:hypothetical protein